MGRPIQSAIATLRAAEWIPMTAARVLIGIFFCISGGTKLFVPAQFSIMEQTMVQSHIPFPHANALFVSLVEFVCGAGLALGLLTPLWCPPRFRTPQAASLSRYSFGVRYPSAECGRSVS